MYVIGERDGNGGEEKERRMGGGNGMKWKGMIELRSGEGGMMNEKDKVYVVEWMEVYKEEEKKGGKKKIGEIKCVRGMLKEYGGERLRLNEIEVSFWEGYMEYMVRK